MHKDGISPTNTIFEPNGDSNFDSSNFSKDIILPENTNVEPSDNSNSDPSSLPRDINSDSDQEMGRDINSDSDQEMDSSDNIPIIIEPGYTKGEGYINSSQPNEVRSLHNDAVESAEGSVLSNDENMSSSSFPSNDIPVCPPFPPSH